MVIIRPQLNFSHFIFIILLFLVGCKRNERNFNDILSEGQLTVLTKNAPHTYYENKDGELSGLEYDLINDFSRYLGVKPRFIVYDNIKTIEKMLRRNSGDIAAAGLISTERRRNLFAMGPSYQDVEQVVVCDKRLHLKRLSQLKGKIITLVGDGPEKETAAKIKKKFPYLVFERNKLNIEDILQRISQGLLQCALTQSHLVAIHRPYYTELQIVSKIKGDFQLAWGIPKQRIGLKEKVEAWFSELEDSGRLKALLDKYYGHRGDYDYYDTKVFLKRMRDVLPKYRPLFKAAAKKYGLPWMLIAAVSYQESHWRPEAKSPTGVRGMMMLTRATARLLKIKNRRDPGQSVMGGAHYIKKVYKRVPHYIPLPDRMWMALASYNVGYYHLRDARAMSVWLEKNPNLWNDIKEVLPLLAQRKYHRKLPHGYARGAEPVTYVKRIRNYYELLVQYEKTASN